MYLTLVNDIDKRWPDNDKECINFFHKLKTLKLLREFIEKIGEDKYD